MLYMNFATIALKRLREKALKEAKERSEERAKVNRMSLQAKKSKESEVAREGKRESRGKAGADVGRAAVDQRGLKRANKEKERYHNTESVPLKKKKHSTEERTAAIDLEDKGLLP